MHRLVASSLALLLGACAHGAPSASPATTAARSPSRVPEATAPVASPPRGLQRLERLPELPARGDCAALEDSEVTRSLPMLGGRLRMPLPDDGRLAPNDPGELRDGLLVRRSLAYVMRGTVQLTVIAWETLRRPGDDLAGYALAEDARDTPFGVVAPMRLGGSLDAVVVESTDPEARTGNVPVAHAFVVSPEGTLVSIAFVVTSVAEPLRAERCRPLVRRLLALVAPGPERLDLDGGPRAIGPLLTLEVPPGYAVEDVSTPEEPKLVLERVHARDELGATLTLTATRHPPDIALPIERPGPYLGRTVSWRDLHADGVERRSAILRIPGHEEYAFSLAEAATVQEVHALMELAGTMRVRR